MKNRRAHYVWMGILASALVIAAVKDPILGAAQKRVEQKLAALSAEKAQTEIAVRQFRDDLAAVDEMKNVMNADEAEKALAPIDRLQAAQILEHRAGETHLTHFAYNVLPEQKTLINTVDAGQQELATSKITLTADAPTDGDAYLFLDAICHGLPGRAGLRDISLQRIGGADKEVSDSNIRIRADIEWLSNGASENLAETSP